ncbi:unnamed protein product [Absidia cylindrospora]
MSGHWKSFLWAQLQKNIEKQGLSSCYVSLALATPSVRTVVFRSFAGEHHRDSLGWTSDALVVTTNLRSRKCKELQHDRRYELCWYMHATGEQFRLRGSVAVYPPLYQQESMPPVTPTTTTTTVPTHHPCLATQAFLAYRQSHAIDPHVFDWEAERRRHFGLLDHTLRATFASSQPKPASLPITAVDPLTGWYVSPDHQAALDDAYTNFCILVLTVKEMDYVSLEGAHEIYTTMSSSALVWELIKNNNSFLVKRDGLQLSSESNNLTNKHSFKYSGLANEKTVGIQAAARGIKVTKNTKKATTSSTVIAKSRRHTAKSVANLIARSKYRPDLLPAALARASAVISSQQPVKAKNLRPAKGVRALKA